MIGIVCFIDELCRVVHPGFYQFVKIKLGHGCVKELGSQELLERFEGICSCKDVWVERPLGCEHGHQKVVP